VESDDKAATAKLTDAERALLAYLDEVNGQDAYSNEDMALGKVSKEEFLVLPTGFTLPPVRPVDVGSPDVHMLFKKKDLAAIYALNKQTAPTNVDAVRYGLMRMEAVKMGWVADQREIRRAPAPADAMVTFVTDLGADRANLSKYRLAAFLIPLVAEHTFRTMGHHFLTGDAAVYEKRYKATLKACLAEEVHGLLAAGVQYHALFHWVSPKRARAVLMSQLNTPRIPDALAIRAYAAPAGTAIVTTTAAVLSALQAAGIYDEMEAAGGFDFDLIIDVTAKVKAQPTRYHRTFYAYGATPLSVNAKAELEEAKLEAQRFAPVAQAFIDSMFADTALNNARALKKHADENPILVRRAQRFFRALARKEATSIKELFPQTADN
jgi:hypothetical protein